MPNSGAGDENYEESRRRSTFGPRVSTIGPRQSTFGQTNENLHHEPVPTKPKEKKGVGLSIFTAIFATRQLAAKGDRKAYIGYTIGELFLYMIYLTILCVLNLSTTSSTTYYYTKIMSDLFIDQPLGIDTTKTFRTSTNINDFWKYTRNVLPRGIHWEPIYGTTRIAGLVGPEILDILYENRVLGVARFRQLRVKEMPCPVADSYHHLNRLQCYLPYDKANEDKGNEDGFWEQNNCPDQTDFAYQYNTEEELSGSSHFGILTTYSGAGAVQNLGRAQSVTHEIINCLATNDWIARGTRAVFLDFTVYNANINLFCVVRLVWEFPATGGMVTSWSLRTVRLIRYLTFVDRYIVFPCEMIFILFTIYYTIQEIGEFYFEGFHRYCLDIWSYVDLSILIISGVSIGFSVYRQVLVDTTLEQLTVKEDIFHDFEFLGFWQTQFNNAASICLFFAGIKLFKYISFNKTMTQLSSTLSRCAKDIGGFAIMFFVVFLAFAQLGFILFGSQVQDFCTFQDSMFTLLRLVLGDFNFRQIEAANRVLGPIFFLAYVFFVFFVLLNMFLAIINDTYSEVKAEIQAQQNEFEIADFFRVWCNRFKGLFGKRDEKVDAETAIKLAVADGQITYDELRANLKSGNFTDVEIEMFLARYELDQDRALDEEEIQQVLADLEGGHLPTVVAGQDSQQSDLGPSRQLETNLFREEQEDVHRRVESIETSVTFLSRQQDEILECLRELTNAPVDLE